MNMDTKNYVDTLFSEYQENLALDDFKEELCGYLNEQIAGLVKGGMDEKSAFEKAAKNLGDMSVVADEISLKKKQEVLSEMYMKTKSYISAKRGAAYALCGLSIGLAIVISFRTWLYFATVPILLFGMAGVLGFVFLGLTQETATHEAMGGKRALLYALAAGLVLSAALTSVISYFNYMSVLEQIKAADASFYDDWMEEGYMATGMASIGAAMLVALLGIALGIFLILTEKDRSKPWVAKLRQEAVQRDAERFGGVAGERFGLICAALWIAATAVFVLLTMLVGLKFSWIAIAAALVIQMVVMAAMIKPK